MSNRIVKGLHSDNRPLYQPEGTSRFALNAATDSYDAVKASVSNEKGTLDKVTIPTGYLPIGQLNLLDDEFILFLANSNYPTDKTSIIAKIDKNYNLTQLVKSSCLAFDPCKGIQSTYRIIKGCERVIYFVDGFNTDKAINIDNLTAYTTNNVSTTAANSSDAWECGLMKLEADHLHPCINLVDVKNTGGNLSVGVYQFSIRYSDDNNDASEWIYVTDPIQITRNHISYDFIEGGDPLNTPLQGKSIELSIENLDTLFPQFEIAVIETINEVSTAYIVDKKTISNSTEFFTYRGLDTTTAEQIEIADIVVDRVTYDNSKTITYQDNRLFRGNLTETKYDWAPFQQAMNSAQVEYFTKANKWSDDSRTYWGPKDAKSTFDTKGYMRDEVYALGVVAVFKTGAISPVFHVPGTAKDDYADGTDIPTNSQDSTFSVPNTHNRLQPGQGTGNTQWDSSLFGEAEINSAYTASGNEGIRELRHLGHVEGDSTTYERWRIFNTAIRTFRNPSVFEGLYNATIDEDHLDSRDWTRGRLSYWESESEYPTTADCNGEPIYPSGKIRHHKMPDTTLEEHFTTIGEDKFILNLGIKISNITWPSQYADDIQGYYIVRVQRNSENKTVLDKGLLYHNVKLHYDIPDTADEESLNIPWNDTDGNLATTTISVNGSKFLHQTAIANRHYWTGNPVPEAIVSINNETLIWENAFAGGIGDTNGDMYYDLLSYSFHAPRPKFFKEELAADFIKLEREYRGDYSSYGQVKEDEARRSHYFINYDESYVGSKFKTNTLISNQGNIEPHAILNGILDTSFLNKNQQEAYLLQGIDPIPHLDNRTELTVLDASSNGEFGSFEDQSICLYAATKKYKPNIYSSLENLVYIRASKCMIDVSNTSTKLFGGDTFISNIAFKKNFISKDYANTDLRTLWVQVISYFVESDVNTELRHETIVEDGTAVDTGMPCTTYHPRWDAGETFPPFEFLNDGDFNRWTDGNKSEEDIYTVLNEYAAGNFCKNYYAYNKDYSKEPDNKKYFPLSASYDYCNTCSNRYPYRVVYSNKGRLDETFDSNRLFKANNFTDVNSKTGEITNMFINADKFFVHTEQSLFMQQVKPQQLTTDTATVYVGIGEVFSIPPKQINTAITGYAGSQHKFATVPAEPGTFFVDARAGKVFLLAGQLQDLSNIGISRFLERELPMVFETDHKRITASDYTCVEGTFSDKSVGIIACYDTTLNRFILHKRDYEIIDEVGYLGVVAAKADPDFTDDAMYRNRSWTLTFDVKLGTWISFHSYLPNFLMNTQAKVYSSIGGNLFEHNYGNYQTYYGTKYDHILEWVTPAPKRTIFGHSEYIQKVYAENTAQEAERLIRGVSFNEFWAYNENQSTGKLTLSAKTETNPYINTAFVPGNSTFYEVEGRTRVNDLRNYISDVSVPIYDQSWTAIKADYPIDKVPNAVDLTKTQYTLDRMRDNYLISRGYFNPVQDYKVVTDLILTQGQESLR